MTRETGSAPASKIETGELVPHLVEHLGSVRVCEPVSEEPHRLLVSLVFGFALDRLKAGGCLPAATGTAVRPDHPP